MAAKYTCQKDGCTRTFDSERGRSLHETCGHNESTRPWQDPEILHRLYHVEGLGQDEIAERLGCCQAQVSRQMRRNNVSRTTKTEAARSRPASFYTNLSGYECWAECMQDATNRVRVHRLLAVAEWGLDAIEDNHIHHQNNMPFDNRPDNLEVLSPSEHAQTHAKSQDKSRDDRGRFSSEEGAGLVERDAEQRQEAAEAIRGGL